MKERSKFLAASVALFALTMVCLHCVLEQRRAGANFSAAYVEAATQPGSFSEVQNAQAAINALADEFVRNVQALQLKEHLSGSTEPLPARRAKTLRMLMQGYAEFRGTAAEPAVLKAVLTVLGSAGENSFWMNAYLDFLYHYPSSPLVQDLAEEAAHRAVLCQAENELQSAFAFVSMVPGQAGLREKLAFASLDISNRRAAAKAQSSSSL